MFGIQGGFGPVGDLMFIHNTKKEDVIDYAIQAFAMYTDIERCLDYGYEMADVFPDNFTEDENEEIYDCVKEKYDETFN